MSRNSLTPNKHRASPARRAMSLLLAGTVAAIAPQFMTVTGADAQGLARVSNAGATQRIKLGLNKSIVIDLPSDAYDILVANPAVADAVTRTARRIYLFGKQVGETNIFVFGANGQQIASLDLAIERDVSGLENHLKRFIPNSDISVELINDNVVLTGTVETPLDASRAAQLATIFVSGGEATTGQYSQTAAGGGTIGGVDINNPDAERRTSQIVNMLKIVGEDQVTLKVTVAEISRTVMKQLGVNLIANATSGGITTGVIDTLLPGGAGGTPAPRIAGYRSPTGSIQAYLNALDQSGVMKTLAEPTLTAVSGEKATFRVGGEFNIVNSVSSAVSRDNQTGERIYGIEKIEYGIGLEFQPVVLSPGRISLKVRTQVSEPTMEGGVAVGDTSIISLRKRLADTTVELPSGGSMMIAGLVRDDIRQSVNGIPGLAKVPVLGALFRSRDFVRNESELVIIVTPYLAKPTARAALARPDDNFNAASDGAGIFLGRVNRVYGNAKTDLPKGRYHGVVGYIYK